MAAKKMFPPREVENPLGDDYDEYKIGITFRIQAEQVVMEFSDLVERVRMTAGGARKLAAMLTEKAAELDRPGKFSRKMEAAVAALLTHRNHEQAARAVGIGTATLLRWQKEHTTTSFLRRHLHRRKALLVVRRSLSKGALCARQSNRPSLRLY